VCLQVSDLNAERCWSVRLAVDGELSHHDSVVGCAAQRPNPPFTGSQMWRMDGEGLVVGVPSSCGLESADVRTVAKLRLSIATDDLVVFGLCKPLFLLFGSSLAFECDLRSQYTILLKVDVNIP
jgi:hypothetical protein